METLGTQIQAGMDFPLELFGGKIAGAWLLRRWPRAWSRRALSRGLRDCGEWGRVWALPLLRFSGDHLPAGVAYGLARAMATILSCLPPYGRSPYYTRRAAQYGIRSGRIGFAKANLVTPFCEFVGGRRILRGKEDSMAGGVMEENAELVRELRATGRPFVVATGHFSRAAMLCLFSPQVTPGQVTTIVANLPEASGKPADRWNQANFGQILEILKGFRPETQVIRIGEVLALLGGFNKLRERGNITVIAADAPWNGSRENSLIRPFGGSPAKAFSLGTARLARLSQSPIAICIPYRNASGAVVMDWRRLIAPPEREDASSDRTITNLILDEIERAALARPAQYIIDHLR